MKQKASDFKIISISLIAIMIFFTIVFFKDFSLNIFNLKSSDFSQNFNIYHTFLVILIALSLSVIFLINYANKTDEELKERYKSIATGIGVILLYLIMPYLNGIPFILLGVDTTDIPLTLEIIYLIAYSALTGAIIVFIYNKRLSADFETFKKNSKDYFSKYIKYWFLALGIMMISNLFINLLVSNDLPSNEQAIRDIFSISPLYIFFSAVIYAPIVEELVFRQSMKNIFSNKYVFIILSGLFFGGMHVFNDFQNITDLLYIIPYSTPGIIFAYMLQKSNNIFVPISFHFIHNGILISLQFLLMLLS